MIGSLLRIGACLAVLWSAAAPAALGDTMSRRATDEQPSEAWDWLKGQLYGERAILDGSGMIWLDAPYRAEDAAIVPIGLSVDPGPDRRVTGLTLVIDHNPVPVAAEFEIGEAMGPRIELSLRVRVDAYTNIRAIAELDDGSLHQFARFVKASGGCSAPALKDQDAAMASLGEVRLRRFPAGDGAATGESRPEAQVMVRHPNNSGFQMDPLSRLYIPALFVDRLSVSQGDELLFRMTGGISISEDPTIRFRYAPNGSHAIHVVAGDTDGREFRESFATDGPELRRSEADHVGLGLRPAQFVDRGVERCRVAQRAHALAAHLQRAQDGLGAHVRLVGDDAGDVVDRAGATLERLPAPAVHGHAGEHVIGPRGGRIVVQRVRFLRRRDGAQQDQTGRNRITSRHGERSPRNSHWAPRPRSREAQESRRERHPTGGR